MLSHRLGIHLFLAILLVATGSVVEGSRAEAAEGSCTRTMNGYRCMYGPFTITEGENNLAFQAAAIPQEGYITGGRVAVVTKDGASVSSHHIHLHHSDWTDPTTPALLCENWPGAVVYMSGKERTRVRFPDGYGFHWKNVAPDPASEEASETGQPYWGFSAMLMGMHSGMEDEVYLRLNFRFEPLEANLQPVQTEFQSVTHCSNPSTYDVIKGSGSNGRFSRKLEFEWPAGARFVWGAGHMHDGGIKLAFRNLTRDDLIFVSKAEYADPDYPRHLTGTTTWSSARGVAVAAGDLMRLRVTYDSTRDWKDVMGNLRITFTR